LVTLYCANAELETVPSATTNSATNTIILPILFSATMGVSPFVYFVYARVKWRSAAKCGVQAGVQNQIHPSLRISGILLVFRRGCVKDL
jgi:hypothetical protein